MIRAVVFDCFGVLCSGSLDHMRSIAPAKSLQDFNDLSLAFDRDYITRQEYVHQAAMLLGVAPAEISDMLQNYCIRNDQAANLVREVHITHKTALLSNIGRGFIDDFFSKAELNELFDTVVLSSEVGKMKPDAAIYRLTAERLGVLPEECVMIDDSETNVDGARRAGMQALHYQNLKQCQTDLKRMLEDDNA